MYKYPYTEGSDDIRKVLLDYIEKEGFINTTPYNYSDIEDVYKRQSFILLGNPVVLFSRLMIITLSLSNPFDL